MDTPAKVKMKYLIPKVVLIELKLSDAETYQKDTLDKGTASSDDGGPAEKSQFIKIQKSKYPLVLLKDLKYTHKKILEQCLKKYYRKRLRQSHQRKDIYFLKEKSSYSRRNLRSRHPNICPVIDLTADDEESEISDNNSHKVSDSENEQSDSSEEERLEKKCHQGKKLVTSNINFEPKSSSKTLKDFHIEAKFKCNDCTYITKYKTSFDAHCENHKNIKLFKCDDCDFESNYRKGLIRHSLNHCSKKAKLNSKKNCVFNESKNTEFSSLSLSEIILLIFNKRKSLDENASVPSPAEPLKCSECSFETENPKYLEFHSQIHSEVQKCHECSYESTDTDTFKNHLIKIHLDESTSESESAPYSFRKRSRQSNKTVVDDSSDEWHSEMSDIKIEELSDDDQPRSKKKFKCQDCTYATSKNKDFVAHCLGHTNKKLFKCEHCDFKTNYERSLKNHNLKCLKNQGNSLSECFNKAIDENEDYHLLSLSEIINLICNQHKSLDHNTFDETTTEVLKCLECTFETGNQKIFNLHSQIHVEGKKCTECNFESVDTETFKDHLISHFKNKNIEEQKMFKCCDCSYKTKYKTSFDAHCAKHKNIKLFKCDDCDFESNYRKGLIRHNRNHCPMKAKLNSKKNCVVNESKNTEFSSLSLSEIILLIFNKRKSLDENASVSSPIELLKCSECNFETENSKYFEFHSQIHSEVQKCHECSYESTGTEAFKNHLIKIHLDKSTTESESAPYSFRKRSRHSNKTVVDDSSDEWHSEMSDIKIEELSDDDQPRRKKKFKCQDCTYATSKNKDFVAHCLGHTNKKLFKCEHCDFKTNYERSLKNHNLKCLKNQGNSLSECFNKAIDENEDYHLLSLSEIINLICNQHKSLDHNTFDETTTEVLKCLECTFETGNQKIFNLHSQIHVEGKKCTECNFESVDTETFKDHLISHFKNKNIEEQKMFKCFDCSYKTKYKISFDAHCAEHKNIKLFKCDDCDFESNYKSHLVSHNLNRCPKKAELNSNENFIVNQSKNSQYFCLSLSEIMLLIFNKMKPLDENASVPSPTEPLKCPECSFETENPKYLEVHSQIHSEVQKCPECGYETTGTNTFRDHLITHLDESTSESESLPYSFRKRSRPSNRTIEEESSDEEYIEYDPEYEDSDIELMDEMPKGKKPFRSSVTHSQKIRDYTCDKCDFKTDSYPSFVSHLLDHNDEKSNSFDIKTYLDNLKDYSFSDIISMICSDDKNLNSETKLHKCSQCSFECSDKMQLSEHLSSHSSEEKFICSQCSFEGTNQSDLDSHLKTHSTFKCSKCSYESYENGILSLHCCEFKSDEVFKCSKCSYECSDIDGLNLHSCEPNSDRIFKCSKCDFETIKEKHLTLHSQLHTKLRKCTECSYSHHSKDKFKDHLLSHLPTKLYTCSECSYKTNFITKFKLHLLNHTNIRVFNCPDCDYKTNYKGSLKHHMETHLEVKSYRCTECDYSTSQSTSLRLHILNHGQTKLFLCGECDYGCNNKARMKAHSKLHSNERPYKCSQCDFSTKHKKNLKEHKARHDGEFSFACSQCDYKCLSQYHLKRHSLKHTNTKLYKCPECSYQCNANLKLHMINMHSKTKMLKCSQCKYESNHKSNYLTHLRTHSNERKYSCTECSFASKRKDNLKVHMRTHFRKKFSHEGITYVNKNHSDEGSTYVNENHSDEGNAYVNENYSDKGSAYVNENHSDEGNAYVNENYSDEGSAYVNENHSDEGNAYVNENHSDEGSAYINFNHSDDLSVLIDESLKEVNAFISESVNVG